ncbi:hypothetical protein QCE63_35180 [Caballeronia sp. LZ065]|uniref:hypothetical protein n=1 Tax=Caballeronia sp. LZ065 TaxID=3038571 RepID=UPI00285A192A|nr:hypothetical protein [Caballeronia sp. LZ065]MDR5784640.1 hypothetical protein [Caballeronia sp. LZ065]
MNNISLLSQIHRARTRAARLQAAWAAAIHLAGKDTIAGHPVFPLAIDLIAAHAKSGPPDTRLSPLEAFRILVDALHSMERRGAYGR